MLFSSSLNCPTVLTHWKAEITNIINLHAGKVAAI